MSAKSLEAGVQYDFAKTEPIEQDKIDKYDALAKTDPEVKRGLDFLKYADAWKVVPPDPDAPLTPAEKKLKDTLDKYNPGAELQDRAFKLKGKITPATMTEAYGLMENELRDQAVKHPENPLYQIQMTKLQEAYVKDVSTIDYVEANAKHGVKIEEKEAILSKFTGPNAITFPDTPPASAPSTPTPLPPEAPPHSRPSARR